MSGIKKIIENKLKTYFKKYSVFGKNNKLIAVKNGEEYDLKKFHPKFSIKGDNNTVIFNCDKISFPISDLPQRLEFKINGDNNRIEFEFPIKIKDITIIMDGDNNLFSIKSTKHPFKDALFRVSHQSSITIGKDSELGNGNLQCICNQNYKVPHKLVIGDGVHIARDTIIRTTDGQLFVDPETGRPLDPPGDIIIGNHVWIMTNCMLIKNTYIPDGCAVAARSFVNKKFEEENCLLGGTPAKILKHNIKWVPYKYKEYMNILKKEKKLQPEWILEGHDEIASVPNNHPVKYIKAFSLSPLEKIFSVKNYKDKKGVVRKIITIAGFKIKIRRRKYEKTGK